MKFVKILSETVIIRRTEENTPRIYTYSSENYLKYAVRLQFNEVKDSSCFRFLII